MTQQKDKSMPQHNLIAPSEYFEKENDGKDHINILYRKAATSLGRGLSHFTKTRFVHPYFGQFESMEGFWFWIRAGRKGDKLRYMSGFEAKHRGRELPPQWTPHFEQDIMAGNYQKIIQTPYLMEEMIRSELPFTHYYRMLPRGKSYKDGEGADIPSMVKFEIKISARDEVWLCKGFEDIRTALKEGRVPDCWVNAEKRYIQEFSDTGKLSQKRN